MEGISIPIWIQTKLWHSTNTGRSWTRWKVLMQLFPLKFARYKASHVSHLFYYIFDTGIQCYRIIFFFFYQEKYCANLIIFGRIQFELNSPVLIYNVNEKTRIWTLVIYHESWKWGYCRRVLFVKVLFSITPGYSITIVHFNFYIKKL